MSFVAVPLTEFKNTEAGVIPCDWTVKLFGKVATLQRGKDLPTSDRQLGDFPIIGSNGIVGYHNDYFAEPCLTVGRSGSVGKVTFYKGKCWALNTALWVKDFHGNSPDFLYHFFQTFDFARYATGVSVPTLNRNYIHDIPVPVPPLAEQQRIAAVLNTLQDEIAAQEDIIAAAKDFKRSLMQRLFTYGPGAEPAPTKMTEIGEIPTHWDICECEQIAEKITVGIVVKPASHYVEGGIPAFRSLNIREDRLDTNNLVFVSPEANDTVLSKSKLKANDVLIVRTGYPGTSCTVPQEFDGANCIDLLIVRTNGVLDNKFLSRYFNSHKARAQVLANQIGLAQQHLNVGAVKRILVPVPPASEQEAIINSLTIADTKTAVEEDRKTALQDAYRSLLHQLMTGQIRLQAS